MEPELELEQPEINISEIDKLKQDLMIVIENKDDPNDLINPNNDFNKEFNEAILKADYNIQSSIVGNIKDNPQNSKPGTPKSNPKEESIKKSIKGSIKYSAKGSIKNSAKESVVVNTEEDNEDNISELHDEVDDLPDGLKKIPIYPTIRHSWLIEKDRISDSDKFKYKPKTFTYDGVAFTEKDLAFPNVLNILKKKIKYRSLKETHIIANYLNQTSLFKKFEEDNLADIGFNKVLTQISSYMEYLRIERKQILFRIG